MKFDFFDRIKMSSIANRFIEAISEGNREKFRKLMVSIDISKIRHPNYGTLLNFAVLHVDDPTGSGLAIIKDILQTSNIRRIIDLPAPTAFAYTPLAQLCLGAAVLTESTYPLIDLLIAAGADVNVALEQGRHNILTRLLEFGKASVPVVRRLITAGINVKFHLPRGDSILDWVMPFGCSDEIILLLIEAGATITNCTLDRAIRCERSLIAIDRLMQNTESSLTILTRLHHSSPHVNILYGSYCVLARRLQDQLEPLQVIHQMLAGIAPVFVFRIPLPSQPFTDFRAYIKQIQEEMARLQKIPPASSEGVVVAALVAGYHGS